MIALDLYGVVAALAVVLAFYFLRNVATYVKTCGAIVVATAVATSLQVSADTYAEGIVLVVGIALFSFGLLFVRVMFIRSVSLNMLRGIHTGAAAQFGEDIGGRLGDMRKFGLIRASEGTNSLTGFGRFVSTVTAALYALLRVKV